jgi:hypothetical protein
VASAAATALAPAAQDVYIRIHQHQQRRRRQDWSQSFPRPFSASHHRLPKLTMTTIMDLMNVRILTGSLTLDVGRRLISDDRTWLSSNIVQSPFVQRLFARQIIMEYRSQGINAETEGQTTTLSSTAPVVQMQDLASLLNFIASTSSEPSTVAIRSTDVNVTRKLWLFLYKYCTSSSIPSCSQISTKLSKSILMHMQIMLSWRIDWMQ